MFLTFRWSAHSAGRRAEEENKKGEREDRRERQGGCWIEEEEDALACVGWFDLKGELSGKPAAVEEHRQGR